jgi:hypothetical protein
MFLKTTLLFILLAGTLLAEEALKKGLLERIVQPKVSLESSYLSDANIKGSEGSVKVHKNTLRINNDIIGFTYSNWAFGWDNIQDLPFGDKKSTPIKEMHAFKININVPYFVNEKWFVLTSASLRSSFEKSMNGSYGAGLFSFASYKIDNDHTVQMGAFANYHKVSTLVLPVISYSYRARQYDGLQVVLGFPRTYIGYHADKDTLFKLGVIFSQSVIKLSDNSSIENSGFIEAKDYMANIGLSHEFNKHLRLESNLLYSLKRDFTIFDAQGNEQTSYAIEPSFGANIRAVWLF